jgi:hypothetical protein
MHPVLPFLQEAAAHGVETVGGEDGAAGLPPHNPASAPAHLLLLGEDVAGLAEPLRRAFPAPGYRVQVASSGSDSLQDGFAPSPDLVVLDLGRSAPSGLPGDPGGFSGSHGGRCGCGCASWACR